MPKGIQAGIWVRKEQTFTWEKRVQGELRKEEKREEEDCWCYRELL